MTCSARHGDRDSLGYFALRRDKSVVFSPSGKAAVSYRVVAGVMLASGDPIGDPEAWPGAIEGFLDEAAHAWTPAVIGCSEEGGTVWTRGAAWTRWSSATRRSWTPPTSPSRAGRCATCGRRSTASSAPATDPCGASATSATAELD